MRPGQKNFFKNTNLAIDKWREVWYNIVIENGPLSSGAGRFSARNRLRAIF